MLKIKVLPVFYGDAILISYGDENMTRVLVDTGTKKSYAKGALKQEIQNLTHVDLSVLTHVDDDHIGGILKYYGDANRKKDFFKKVIFNSGSLITDSKTAEIALLDESSTEMSIKGGISLEKSLKAEGIWDQKIFKAGDSFKLNGAGFTILSPDGEDLDALSKEWKKETDEVVEMAASTDYKLKIGELSGLPFKETGSLQNKTSIAFLFQYEGSRILMLGDAFPSVIEKNLRKLGYSETNRLKLDGVKLSHHGSRFGMSPSLLELLDCSNFIISSDGTKGNPSKECLARIITSRENVTLFFNYRNDIISNIFFIDEPASCKFAISYLDSFSEPYTITIR